MRVKSRIMVSMCMRSMEAGNEEIFVVEWVGDGFSALCGFGDAVFMGNPTGRKSD